MNIAYMHVVRKCSLKNRELVDYEVTKFHVGKFWKKLDGQFQSKNYPTQMKTSQLHIGISNFFILFQLIINKESALWSPIRSYSLFKYSEIYVCAFADFSSLLFWIVMFEDFVTFQSSRASLDSVYNKTTGLSWIDGQNLGKAFLAPNQFLQKTYMEPNLLYVRILNYSLSNIVPILISHYMYDTDHPTWTLSANSWLRTHH